MVGFCHAHDHDAAGRLVVPEAIREELALDDGQEVELTTVEPDRPLPSMTMDLVRATLEKGSALRAVDTPTLITGDRRARAIYDQLGVEVLFVG